MVGRQSVRVTYAHKRRRIQSASNKLASSPLEVLPPDMDDLTRTQMAHRMLKRSRRVALGQQLEDKNAEHVRDHLAKRIKRAKDSVSNSLDRLPQDDLTFQTPFSSSQAVREETVAKPIVPEQLSPVPVAKRVISRTSSRNLKENSTHSQALESPFSSRPGSAAPSPKRKGKDRSSRRFHAKSRTLSGVFKENARQVSRKNSTMSLRDSSREPPAKHGKHHPSSPALYMHSRLAHEDWIVPPKASLGKLAFGLLGTSPVYGGNLIIRRSRHTGAPTLRAAPLNMIPTCPPSSPASGLALELRSMDICGPDVYADEEAQRPCVSTPPRAHSHSIVVANSTAKRAVKRMPARNRGGTNRASDFGKPGTSSNVRRTRSGTVVGPDSNLAAKGAALSSKTAKGGPVKLAAVQSGSESESDDELLLKDFWTEGLVYLGTAPDREEAEPDELNLGGLWHGLEFPPQVE